MAREWTLKELAERTRKRLRDDYDSVICISGGEGRGKSACGMNLCKLIDPSFNFDSRVAYTSQQIGPLLDNTPRYGAVLIDEGTTALYKRDAAKRIIKELIKKLSQVRFRNLAIIICTPRLIDLDIQLREHRVALLLHVKKRGFGLVFFKDPRVGIGAGDPWHLNDFKAMKKHCYQGWFEFPDIPPKWRAKYMKIKEKSYYAFQDSESQEEGEDGKTGLVSPDGHGGWGIINAIHEKAKMSYEDMSLISGYSANTIRQNVKRWRDRIRIKI